MVEGHAGCFRAAEFGENCANSDILDCGRGHIGVLGEDCTQDGGEHLLWVGIAEATFVGAGDGCAEGGEEDDIIRMLVKDVSQSFLELSHQGGRREYVRLERCINWDFIV